MKTKDEKPIPQKINTDEAHGDKHLLLIIADTVNKIIEYLERK